MFGNLQHYKVGQSDPDAARHHRDTADAFGPRRPRRPVQGTRSWLLAAAAIGTCLTSTAMAESARMWSSDQAITLHEGPLDLEARWIALADGDYEVTATFIARDPGAKAMRSIMRLAEGDEVTFAMPGHPTMLYRFARDELSVWPMRIGLPPAGVSATVHELTARYAAR